MQHLISDYMELNEMRYECYVSHDSLMLLSHDEVYLEVMEEMEKILHRLYLNAFYQLKRTYSKNAEILADQYIKGILVKPVETGYHIAIKRLTTLLKGCNDTGYALDCLQAFLESTYIVEYIERRRQEQPDMYSKRDLMDQTKERLDRMVEFYTVMKNLYEIHTDLENDEIGHMLHKQHRILLNQKSDSYKFKQTIDEIRNFLGGLCLK